MLIVHKIWLSFLLLFAFETQLIAQISSPAADYTEPTQYTNGMPDDEIFVFCSPDVNGNPVTGSLVATPTIAGPGFTFEWGIYDETTHTYTPFQTTNGATSSVSNLGSGGYSVTITNNAGVTETFITWVYVSIVAVDVSLALDPTNPGCEPFDVNGTINASGFTYWDPVDPGEAPFIIDANTTIEVCFSANHTYVSDLGFVLIGPPGCGSPGVALYPHPQVVNAGNGCCCNSGNNVNNLCFSTASNTALNMCNSGTPLGGTYQFYNGAVNASYPAGGVSNLYGCNAAEGGWAVQIYDCIGADVGALTNATITFSNGTSTINYASGAINSAINDNSCDQNTASIYVVPLTTPVNPNPQQVPNSGTLTYQLGLNGNPVSLAPGTNSFTETIDPIPTYDEWYYLFIQDQLGCSAIDSAMFDYTGYADATIDPVPQFCTGSAPFQLTAVTPGGTWSGTGVSASGMFDPASAGTGIHTITYTITNPCGNSETVDISVGDLTANTSSTASVCTANNGTATLTPLTGVAPYSYSWSSTPVQTTATAINLPPGTYDVDVEDADGCSLSTTVTVGFDPSDLTVSIPTFVDALCNQSCDGTATAIELGGTAPYQFAWDDPNLQQTAQATGLCAGTYNVGVADVNGCLATSQITISEPTAITASAVMDNQSNCGNPDGQASATANGGTVALDYAYNWNSTPVQTTAVATNLVPATYTVTVTDDNGCTETADVVVSSTPGFTASISSFVDASCFQLCDGEATIAASNAAVTPLTYSWNTTPVQTTPTATNLCAGTYIATITDGVNCTATASVSISEPTMVSTSVAASASPICIGENSNLTGTVSGGTQPYTTTWTAIPNDPSLAPSQQNPTVSPIFTTDYSLIVTDANGCASIPKTVTVEVMDPLTLSVARPLNVDTGICPYDFATIDLIATGGDGVYSYFLHPDLNTPISLPMQVQPSATTAYDFVVIDGCTTPQASTSSTITVFTIPTVDFVGDELEGCDPHITNFTDLTHPTPITWNWNFGDSNSNANSSTIANPVHAFSGPGLYDISLDVVSADGCISDSTKTEYIEVFPLPYANFEANPEKTNVLDAEITFTDLSVDSIANWNWDFGTGDLSTEQHPVYTYRDTGTYLVWLHVITNHGCEDETSRQIEIEPDFMFYVPNAFSPNADRRNDSFRGYGEGINWDTYEMTVYNRWGEEIFYTNSISSAWNGTFKGKQVENDTYVWLIKLIDLKGNEHVYRGHVTVVR